MSTIELLTILAQFIALVYTTYVYKPDSTEWHLPAFWSIIFGLAIISDKV